MASPKRGGLTKDEKIVQLLDKIAENLLEERPEGKEAVSDIEFPFLGLEQQQEVFISFCLVEL